MMAYKKQYTNTAKKVSASQTSSTPTQTQVFAAETLVTDSCNDANTSTNNLQTYQHTDAKLHADIDKTGTDTCAFMIGVTKSYARKQQKHESTDVIHEYVKNNEATTTTRHRQRNIQTTLTRYFPVTLMVSK